MREAMSQRGRGGPRSGYAEASWPPGYNGKEIETRCSARRLRISRR